MVRIYTGLWGLIQPSDPKVNVREGCRERRDQSRWRYSVLRRLAGFSASKKGLALLAPLAAF
jgi:hypothetical protein